MQRSPLTPDCLGISSIYSNMVTALKEKLMRKEMWKKRIRRVLKSNFKSFVIVNITII